MQGCLYNLVSLYFFLSATVGSLYISPFILHDLLTQTYARLSWELSDSYAYLVCWQWTSALLLA